MMQHHLSVWAAIALIGISALSAHGQEGPKKERIAVMVFTDKAVDERVRVLIERDIRNMVVSAESNPSFNGRLYPIEPFFDVGQLSNAKLRSSLRHFNEAQRAFEKGDYDEAKGQLRRAERFYLKGIPFIYNGNEELLLGLGVVGTLPLSSVLTRVLPAGPGPVMPIC